MQPRRYSEEETRRILQEALEHQNNEQEFSREHLLQMAEELDISPDNLAKAEKKWQKEIKIDEELVEFDHYRRQKFKKELVSYGIVMTFLFFINLFTSPEFFWVVFPLLGWGMGLAFQFAELRQIGGDKYEKELETWRTKRRIESSAKRLRG